MLQQLAMQQGIFLQQHYTASGHGKGDVDGHARAVSTLRVQQ